MSYNWEPNDSGVPESVEYLRALKQIWDAKDRTQVLTILKEHLSRGGRITMTQAATASGYSSHMPANAVYGSFAKELSEALQQPQRRYWLEVLAELEENADAGHDVWVLRPGFKQALSRFEPTARFSSKESTRVRRFSHVEVVDVLY